MRQKRKKGLLVINKKLIIVGVIVAATLGFVFYLITGGSNLVEGSSVSLSKASTINVKGNKVKSAYIKDNNEEYNEKQQKIAAQSNASYLAEMGSVNAVQMPKKKEIEPVKHDSAMDWMQQHKKQEPKVKPKENPVKHNDGIHLSAVFEKQLADALKNDNNKSSSQGVSFTTVVSPQYAEEMTAQPPISSGQKSIGKINAGTTLYGVVTNKIDSDFKNVPAIAKIKIGKYSGATVIGKVSTGNEWVTGVAIKFDEMIYKGMQFKINAIATNADYQPNLYDNVNNHWVPRILGLVSGSLLGAAKGVASAYTGANTQVVITPGGGQTTTTGTPSGKQLGYMAAGGAATDLSGQLEPVLKNLWNRPPTITVDVGHAIGILFVNTVNLKEPTNA